MKKLILFCLCFLCISQFSFAEKFRVLDAKGNFVGMCDGSVCGALCYGYSCYIKGSKPTKTEYVESLKGLTVKRIKGEIQIYNGKYMFLKFKSSDLKGLEFEAEIKYAKLNQLDKIRVD
ncbi:MAG: hypothetical protein KA319_14275 [Ferruginibacter sp.]|nr:hypothetical protein [Ferruginibacter sp.]